MNVFLIDKFSHAESDYLYDGIPTNFYDTSFGYEFFNIGEPFYYFFGESKITKSEIDKEYNIYIEIPEITENYDEDLDFKRETLLRMVYLFNKNTDFHFDKNKKTLKISFLNNRVAYVKPLTFTISSKRRKSRAYSRVNYKGYNIFESLGIVGVDTSSNSVVFKNFVFYLTKIGVTNNYCLNNKKENNKDVDIYTEAFKQLIKYFGYDKYGNECDLGKRNFDEFLFIVLAKSIGYNYNFKDFFNKTCSITNNVCDVDKILKKYINGYDKDK